MSDTETPKVVAAAIRIRGNVFSRPAPARHGDLLLIYGEPGTHPHPTRDQGFVLDDGRFVGRLRAVGFAKRAGQITAPKWPPYLYSEDLW